MKKLLVKIPAMIAMVFTLLSFYCYIQSFIDVESEVWMLSAILAAFSMLFYFPDAIITLVKAIKKEDRKFNFILFAVLIVAIPMVLIFGGSSIFANNIIWNVYYLLMFVLEIISIKKACDMMRAARAK